MKFADSPRREFLQRMGGLAGAAWFNAHWPAVAAAAQHAHHAAKAGAKFEVLTPEQAREVEAVASRILPTDDMPGATEAGVVYFIDRALQTFDASARPAYEQGLAGLNELAAELFPGVKTFSSASIEQQDKILGELATELRPEHTPIQRNRHTAQTDFIQTIWSHTLAGFLADPEAGGNRDYAGWKAIGRDPAHTFNSPFGFYDKDYPGWQPPAEAGKK